MTNINENKKANELIGKASPELLLNMHHSRIHYLPTSILVSEPVLLWVGLLVFDVLLALILGIIDGEAHIMIFGGMLFLLLPWPIIFLDGLIFVGYGIYVIHRKSGELDISSSSHGPREIHKIYGEAASVLGFLYVILGVILLFATVISIFWRY